MGGIYTVEMKIEYFHTRAPPDRRRAPFLCPDGQISDRPAVRKEIKLQITRRQCRALLLCLLTLFSCVPMYASATSTEEIPSEAQTALSDDELVISEETADTEITVASTEEAEVPPSTEEIETPEAEPVPTEEPPADSPESETGEPELSEAEHTEVVKEEAARKGVRLLAASSSKPTFSTILSSSQMTNANCYLTYVGGSGKKAVPIHRVTLDGKTYWGYCADSRDDWPGDGYNNYTEKTLPGSNFYQIQKIAMQLGFGDNDTARLKAMFGYDLNNYEAYQATQAVIWGAQVWEEQWHYINPTPSSVKKGVTDYWQVTNPSGNSKNPYNYTCAVAEAVQSVYTDGIGCDISMEEASSTTTAVRFKITIKPKNYYGGYSATISGAPSSATLSSTDSDVTVANNTSFSSTASSGTDSLYLTIPKTSSEKSYAIKVTVTPTIQVYKANSAVGYLEPASSSYQPILYSGGTLSTAPVSASEKVTVTDLPKGKITITKLDSQTKKPVPEVTFELYKYDGSKYVATGITAVSNSKGVAEFTGLAYDDTCLGRYRVFEKASDTHDIWTNHYVCWVSVASGLWYSYESATAEQQTGYAEANSSGDYDFSFRFTAYNDELIQTGSLTIIKKDGTKPLANVSFVLTDSKGKVQKVSKDKDGAYILNTSGSQTMVTDKNGKIAVKELPFGTYLVTEVSTADGSYTLLPTSFTVTLPAVDKTGNDQLDLTYTVLNNASFTLPKTGGTGVSWTPGAGLLLMALLTISIFTFRKGDPFYEENQKNPHLPALPCHGVRSGGNSLCR